MRILLLGFSQKKSNYEINRLIIELKKRGHVVNYAFWKGLVFTFNKKGVSIQTVKNGRDLKYYDYIIPRSPLALGKPKKQKDAQLTYLSHLYRHYLLIVDYINKFHKHILNEKTANKMMFYDKLFQHYLLAKNGVPVISSVLYTGRQLPASVYKKFKRPYVLKSIEGSRGKQVFLIQNLKESKPLVEQFGLGKAMVQKYVPAKSDMRVIVIGNKVVGAMKRTASEGEFRANVALGGYVESVKVSKELKDLALKSARVFRAEFAGVDVIKHKGKYYVLEINIFPMFEGFEAATKINVAQELVKHIEKKYLWSLETEFTKKEKRSLLDILYKIEKENLEKPSLTRQKFLQTLLKRDLIVINKEKKPIAYLTHYKKEGVRRITRYGILPRYRGQRMGRRMLRALIKIAKSEKDKEINAVVPVANKRRQLTFKRAGFIKTKDVLKDHFGPEKDGVVFKHTITSQKKAKGPGLTKSGKKPSKNTKKQEK